MNPSELSLLFQLLTIFFAGVAAYVGVKIAIAELRGDVKRHDEDLEKHEDRLNRLEAKYFSVSRDDS